MAEETKPGETGAPAVVKTRPVVLSALCMFSFVYFGVLTLLFLSGLFKTTAITRIMDQYLSTGAHPMPPAAWIFSLGFALHGLALAGVIMIWNLRRTGYFMLGVSCIAVSALQLFNPMAAVSSTAIYIIFVLLFGLFYNRLR